jgi:hypothetical protein
MSKAKNDLLNSIVRTAKERPTDPVVPAVEPVEGEQAPRQEVEVKVEKPETVAPQPRAEARPAVRQAATGKTERITVLLSPDQKKHLKRLAVDMDTDMSELVITALKEKNYLPKS